MFWFCSHHVVKISKNVINIGISLESQLNAIEKFLIENKRSKTLILYPKNIYEKFVDEKIKLIGYDKANWLTDVPIKFYIHRSFSIIVLIVNFYLLYLNKKLRLGFIVLQGLNESSSVIMLKIKWIDSKA